MRQLYVAVSALIAFAACGGNPSGPGGDDAPPDAPDGIAAARAAADGTGLALAIHGATVTYVKPAVGNPASDPAGFTIQAAKPGPALFIAVDPATLTPPAAVGDVVDFTITAKATVASQPRAQAVTGYTRMATGGDVAALVQDLTSATDVVTAIDSYDSELVSVTGSVFEPFTAGGTGFQRAGITTTGLAANPSFQLRAPAALVDALDMVKDCKVTVARVPMGRFNAQAQLGAFSASDVTLSGCPAPVVVNAVAQSATSLRLVFSRNLKPSSIKADGSQFTFDNGLTATHAVVLGRTVTLTTTTQGLGTSYVATVAASVTDLQGSSVATPGTAAFAGFVAKAVVRLNEINASITGGCDLIELRVIADGSMTGFTLTERTGTVGNSELAFTFPTFFVHRNDLIVVHMNAGSQAAPTTCNPNHATQETATPSDQAAAAFAGNFDTAFDFWASDAGLTATNNVFALHDATGAIQDAVFVSDGSTTAVAAATKAAAAIVGTASQWAPAQTTYTDAEFIAAAVVDLDATGTTAAGTSIQRLDDRDGNTKADWTSGAGAASTWGALNANQQPITAGLGALLSVHTTLGIPAPTSLDDPDAYLSVKADYVVSYNSSRKVPNWVSWELNSSYIGSAKRQDTFRPDDTLPVTLPQAQLSDYSGSGYDRGHMCPSADRTLTDADNSQTFYLTNMVPQAANNNQGPWEKLEAESRTIAATGKELFIISGGTFSATSNTVGNGVVVPDYTFKVIVVLDAVGQGSANVTAATRVIAVVMPNENTLIDKGADWHMFRVSVDTIEAMTGYDFLSDVDPAIQAVVEARVDNL